MKKIRQGRVRREQRQVEARERQERHEESLIRGGYYRRNTSGKLELIPRKERMS